MTAARDTTGRSTPAALPFVVGAVGVVVGLVLAFVLPAVGSDGWSKQAKAAESVAQDFISRCYTIDPAQPDATVTGLSELVTDEFTGSCFDLLAPTDEEKAALATAEISFGDVVISSVGATQVDGDSANVVVTFTFTGTSPQATTPAPLASRGIVQLVDDGGTWKVSDYSEIPQVDAVVGDAPTPSATPSPEATP